MAAAYRRLEGPLFRKCLQVLRNEDAARDAAQEVFVKLQAKWEQLESPDAELAWALRAAERHCLNVLRASKRREAREQSDEVGEEHTSSPVTNRQLGRAVLEGLSETSRALVVDTVLHEEEHQAVARKHGVSTKTVGRKLKAAFDKARSVLKKKP